MAQVKMAGPAFSLLFALSLAVTSATTLPPRLSSYNSTITVKEGDTGVVISCTLDVGDDPISYRWLKNHQWVTGALGYSYRGYRQVFLALHPIKRLHAGSYICEASNEAGLHSDTVVVNVENGGPLTPQPEELPHTDETLSSIATSFSDVLAEGDCTCDVLFFLHASTDSPEGTMAAQANLVHTIADSIVSESLRVGVVTYSDYITIKLPVGRGTNRCELRDAFKDLSHQKWATRMKPVLRETFKRIKKSRTNCKVLFLPIFGSLGAEGPDYLEAQKLKKLGVKIFILEVTPKPIEGVAEMASERGDGKAYHWHVPLHIWPTIVMYMKYMTEELVGCMPEEEDIPGVCVGSSMECSNNKMCRDVGYGCVAGICQPLECNINPTTPGCCATPGQYWCGDVTKHCTDKSSICDGHVQCMNGADEDRCWSNPCPEDKVARCQSSTLCLDLMDLCDGEPACPGGEDEDPRFCRSFPCPTDRPFRCRSGKCIEKSSLCDGSFKDCEEGEDEDLHYCSRVHTCPESQPFKCDYGICISERMLCDGSYRCLDASDELVCGRRNCPAERPYKCHDGLCISMDKVCNGIVDGCDDGSDEHNCTEVACPLSRNFKCDNGQCIDGWLVCDTIDDCDDGSDELNCALTTAGTPTETEEPTCLEDEFTCNNGACISENKVCNGRRNCLDGEDESDCATRPCPTDRPHRCADNTCVVSAPPCDGIKQCRDGSDEIDCTQPEETDDYDYEDEDYDSDDYLVSEPTAATTASLPTIDDTMEPKRKAESEAEVTKMEKDSVEGEDETVLEDQTVLEEGTIVEEPIAEEEPPPQRIDMHHENTNDNTHVEDDDIMETMFEEPEVADVRPAASSEKDAAATLHAASYTTHLLVFMITLCLYRFR